MTLPKSIHAALREILVAAAGVWVLAGAKDKKEYVYVHDRWVEIVIRYNGEEAPPHRRAEDVLVDKLRQYVNEADYLAPEMDEKQRLPEPAHAVAGGRSSQSGRAANAKRLEDLGSDRSQDA